MYVASYLIYPSLCLHAGLGMFDDPFLSAFRGKGPQQHLYTVSFSSRDLWKEGYNAPDSGSCDYC